MQSQTVAPADRLRQEIRMLQDREVLRTTLEIEEAVFMQSVVGRAHEGHGTFAGRRYVDTTEDDVALALRLDPVRVRAFRQQRIDDVAAWVERVITGERPERLVNGDGEPLFGFSPFRFLAVDAPGVLAGLYLGGMRDTQETRLEAEREYDFVIGAGKHYFVNTEVMRRLGLNGDLLAHGDHSAEIAGFRQQGLVVEQAPSHDNPVSYMYIRHHRGPGASDDAATAVAGRLYGASAAVGVFLADAIDTLEKYVPSDRYADQDANLARRIESGFSALPVGPDQARQLTYLSRGGDGVPDSSLRHLLRVDRSADECAAESHLLYAAGLPYSDIGLAHEKIGTRRFYGMIDKRLAGPENKAPA